MDIEELLAGLLKETKGSLSPKLGKGSVDAVPLIEGNLLTNPGEISAAMEHGVYFSLFQEASLYG